MRVLEIVKGLDIGGAHGGAERFGADLSIALAQKGVQVELCAFYRSNTPEETKWYEALNRAGVSVFSVANWKGGNDLIELVKGLLNLPKFINLTDIDIIHSHTQLSTLAALLLGKLSGKKIVRTAHVAGFEWGKSCTGRIFRFIFGEWVFPFLVDTHVAVSKATYRNIENYMGMRFRRKSPILIYNAIPIPQSQILSSNFRRDHEDNDYVIGTIARLTEQKGISYLIEAASIVKGQFPNVKFLVAGDGELRETLKKQIDQRGLSDTFFLIGKTPNPYEFLTQLDLFVLPSLWEGLPSVILESMIAGVPVIATDIPGTDELIQNDIDGWLVPPRDAMALAEKIVSVLRSPELRKKMAQSGQRKAEQFSMDRIAEQYLTLFKNLLA